MSRCIVRDCRHDETVRGLCVDHWLRCPTDKRNRLALTTRDAILATGTARHATAVVAWHNARADVVTALEGVHA